MLLAVDCSTQMVGLALYDGSQVLGEVIWRTHNHHTVEMAPAIQDLMTRTGVRPNQLTGLGVALGPGSFTSLRIGLAVVKGMALGLHLPVAGVPTLDVLAAAQPVQPVPMAAVLQAGRTRLALGWYAATEEGWKSQGDPVVVTASELSAQIHKPTLVCGELTADERQLLARKRVNVILPSPANQVRRPAILAELAWRRLEAGLQDDVVSLSPIYLHIIEGIAA